MMPDQVVAREERVAIMTFCGGVDEVEAQRYCDGWPQVYGIRDGVEEQLALL